MKIENLQIEPALQKLTDKYPTLEVDIWARVRPGVNRVLFIAKVEAADRSLFNPGMAESAAEAVSGVVAAVGDSETARENKIASLRAELDALLAQRTKTTDA